MDQSLHTPKPYDYRQYDRIWQRVAPELEPYPGWKEQAVPALEDLTPRGVTSGTVGGAGTAAQGADAAPEAASRTEAPQEAQPSAGLTLAEETRPIQGGFILVNGRVEINCTFDTLVRLQRSETAGSVAKQMFPEG